MRTNTRLICRLSRETKQYPIRKRAYRRQTQSWHSTKAFGQAEMEDQLVSLWQQQECLYNVSCKTFILKSLRGLPCSQLGLLVENLLVCGVLPSSHRSTPHTIGAKRLNLGFFCSPVCGLSYFEDLVRFKDSNL